MARIETIVMLLASMVSLTIAQHFYPDNFLNILTGSSSYNSKYPPHPPAVQHHQQHHQMYPVHPWVNYPLGQQQQPSGANVINPTANFNTKPLYIDNTSSPCPIIYYPKLTSNKFRVAKNCSNLNLAANWTLILTTNDNFFITELLLAYNQFQYQLPYQVINSYDSLTGVDLSYNLINENLNDLRLIDCSRCDLREMNLTGNLFSRFPTFHNNCMYQLEILRLDKNVLITSIDYSFTYYRMPRLVYLDMSYCSINYINTQLNITLLEQFPRLEYLNLIGNKLKIIYENPFYRLYFLIYLNFEYNQIECVQTNLWLKKFLISRRLYSIELATNLRLNVTYSPTCLGCLTNQTNNILTLPDSSFCTPIYLNSSIPVQQRGNLKVDQGQQIYLDCQAYSIPASDLWWTFNDRVLSKISSQDSPYEFIENFANQPQLNNKTSTLRIKNFNDQLSGVYSCNAWYLDTPNVNKNLIKKIRFNVGLNEVTSKKMGLSAGEIAAIVIGSLLGFLLLCILCGLCAFCCCWKRGFCCCFRVGGGSSNKSSSTTSTTHLFGKGGSRNDLEEISSGFNELNKTKPNYVISTICKSNSYLNEMSGAGECVDPCSGGIIYKKPAVATTSVESVSSWRIQSPTIKKMVTIEETPQLCPINNNDTYVYNVKESIMNNEQQNGHYVDEYGHFYPSDYHKYNHHHHHSQSPCDEEEEHATEHHFHEECYHHHQHQIQQQQPQYEPDLQLVRENFVNQVIVTNEGNTYNIMSPASRKQPTSSQHRYSPPDTTTTSTTTRVVTNSCFKYDSDV